MLGLIAVITEWDVLGLLKKRGFRKNVLAAVCPDPDGIAVALIRREQGVPPCLEYCDHIAVAADRQIGDALSHLVKHKRLDTIACSSVIALDDYSLLLVEAPDVPPAELRAAMRWRVKDLIDFHIDDAVIDVFEIPGQRTAGGSSMMYAVVARSSAVKQRIDQLVDSGLSLEVIDIPEFSIRNIAAMLPEDVGGAAFVFLAPEHGLITLTRQSTLYLSRRLESGSRMLAQAGTQTINTEIEGWLDAIVIEIQRSLDYYDSHFSQPPVAGVVLAPLGVAIQGITDYLGAQLGLPVRELDLNTVIDTTEPIDHAVQAHCFSAIGAALRSEERAL